MTCLQASTHGRQARLLSSGRRLVQFALCQPLLVGACEKLFRVLEVDDVGVIKVTGVIDGDPRVDYDKADGAPCRNVDDGVANDVEVEVKDPCQMLTKA